MVVDIEAQSWRKRAACAHYANMFDWYTDFPSIPQLEICSNCPVMQQCRDEALAGNDEQYVGIYGGLTDQDRRDVRAGRASLWALT